MNEVDAMIRRIDQLHDKVAQASAYADNRLETTRKLLDERVSNLQREVSNLKMWALTSDVFFFWFLFYFLARGLRWI